MQSCKVLLSGVVVLVSIGSACAPGPAAPATAPAPAAASPDSIHRSAIVIDTHDDVTQRMVVDGANLAERLPDTQTDIPRMREGGLDAEFLSVFVPPMLYPGAKAYDRSLEEFSAIDRLVAANQAGVVLARTAGEVRAAAAGGKIAFLIGVEGGHSLGEGTDDDLLAHLRDFYDRGARYMTLTWSNSNRLGGSSGDDGRSRGLTPLGARVVSAMNDLGMMVDVSHVSDPTFFDAVRASRVPVIASHSSARALADRPRNMTDEMLRAVARNRGAVCVNFGPEFLDAAWAARLDDLEKGAGIMDIVRQHAGDPQGVQAVLWHKFKELAASLPPVPASKVIDHIEYISRVAGVDHVCLGSDFDGVPAAPAGLDDVSKMPFITQELLRRGFSADDVRKILGENVLRVLEAAERGRKQG
ncbi:MAG TPA: dipeptidase [Polyangiaceae bacterium]|nr:dipeptidase [Polyangiaceae bacterium]